MTNLHDRSFPWTLIRDGEAQTLQNKILRTPNASQGVFVKDIHFAELLAQIIIIYVGTGVLVFLTLVQ